MPELLLATQYIDYAKSFVLPLLRLLQCQQGKPVRSGFVGEHLGLQRRQTYNYLRALEIAGLARLEGRRWKVV